MTLITRYYGLPQAVPFLNVHVDQDNRLFIDPYAIRIGVGPARFTRAANECTASFFGEVTRCVLSSAVKDQQRGLKLLQKFEEPKETRLGMSAAGFDGHGGSTGVGQDIWETLTGDLEALVRIGLLNEIEQIPVFVGGVGNDITSDLTTRVIFKPLANYTAAMVKKYPALAGGTGLVTVPRQVWDRRNRIWIMTDVTLPSADGAPLLLIPEKWARHQLMLTSRRFYETTVLSHVQDQRATVGQDGKLLKTPKERLKQDARLQLTYESLINMVEDAWTNNDVNLLSSFQAYAKERYEPTTVEQFSRRIA